MAKNYYLIPENPKKFLFISALLIFHYSILRPWHCMELHDKFFRMRKLNKKQFLSTRNCKKIFILFQQLITVWFF